MHSFILPTGSNITKQEIKPIKKATIKFEGYFFNKRQEFFEIFAKRNNLSTLEKVDFIFFIQGLTNLEIAVKRNRSIKTIKCSKLRINKKLNFHSPKTNYTPASKMINKFYNEFLQWLGLSKDKK